jgi:DNA-binding PadR family transcriptional regulator
MARKSEVLELAILGTLQDAPLHGYELRKRISTILGTLRTLSYGSLYPALKELTERGLIAADDSESAVAISNPRGRIVYRLTSDGKDRLHELLAQSGPAAWEDEGFGVRVAFFAQTEKAVRLRILEGRRSRLEERLETLRDTLARRRERLDAWTMELQRHGEESVEREVRWLSELIDNERASGTSVQTGNDARASQPTSEKEE